LNLRRFAVKNIPGKGTPLIEPKDITVFIDPVTHHFLNNELFNPNNRHNIDNAHEPYFYLRDVFRAKGIDVHTADYLVRGEIKNKVNVYFSLGIVSNFRELAKRSDVILSGIFTFEAPIVQPSTYKALRAASKSFKRIYCYAPSEALSRFGCAGLKFRKFQIPYTGEHVFEDLWNKRNRKFLNLLNWNRLSRRSWQELYTERLRALDFFSRYGEIDLYGMGWDRAPYVVGETRIPNTFTRIHRYIREHVPFVRMHPYEEAVRKTYRGVAKSKYQTQSDYTFTICYENMILPGWLNENIFDCFLVGTIPIYLGPPDVTDYVPAECFIDKRQFPTYPELRAFLKSLSEKDIQTYRENARDFVASDMYKPFLKEAFANHFVSAVEEDTGVNLRGGI
jgi:hypothetical protein